ncbi:hypothetical protein LSAT2_026511 [Lamellibrachia satsuma]|nr:hypothetical protein LSAT2_026511 [Lamellibrachia satsuma]
MLRRFLLIWHCCLYPQGWAVQLTTNAIYKQESDIAKLQCIEKGLLGTQLQWQKHLQTNLSDYVTVANTAAVLTPFSATGRYSATYNETNGRTSFIVTIKELRIEDSGVYECVTDSGESKRKLQLHVVVPVQYVELLGALNSSETIQRISSQPSDPLQNVTNFLQRHLTYDVRHAGIVECMAYGGNPQPHVRIFVGIDEISVQGSNMQQSRTFSLEGTTRGLQWYNFSVRQYSYNFRLAPRADGQLMRCVGDVDEKRDSKSASAMLTVLGKY